MFLKVKIVMVEFSNPGIILMSQTLAEKMCKVSKTVEDLFSNSCICVSPMTDSTAWEAARRAGSAKQRQNQRELSTKKKKKKMFLVQTSLLHYVS